MPDGIACFLCEDAGERPWERALGCPENHLTWVPDESLDDDAPPPPAGRCPECGAALEPRSERRRLRVYRRTDTGETLPIAELPPGAMWEAPWMASFGVNGDGPVIVVRLPNGREWLPGSRARNCDRPGEDHDCWCVHGEPPDLTVDKTPEPGRTTCSAGAGSISSETAGSADYWHGFLRAGRLVEA